MNFELFQISKVVTKVRYALKTGNPLVYLPAGYESGFGFALLPRGGETQKQRYLNPLECYEELTKIGLQDVKLLCPTSVHERHFLGFVNTSQSSMVCFFENGESTYFTPNWKTNSKAEGWNILYTEHTWENPPIGKPLYENNTDAFRKALLDIQRFAIQIGYDHFAEFFGTAIKILDKGVEFLGDNRRFSKSLPLQDPHLRIFEAAAHADVFGGNSSWNDDPGYSAYDMGLSEEYDRLSDELLKNIRFGMLYAVNEW